MINRVILVGRITKDPEIKYTSTGIATLSFSIAVDRQVRDSNGERQADFINCVAWRNNAEFLSRYVKKGYMISVEGRIQTRTYQSTTDNQTRYVTEVVCDSVSNLQPRDVNSQAQANYQPQQNQQNRYNNQGYSQQSNQGYFQQPQNTTAPAQEKFQKESFSVDVADDDLPF